MKLKPRKRLNKKFRIASQIRSAEALKIGVKYLNAVTGLFFIRDENFELRFISEALIERLGYSSVSDVPRTKYWRFDPTKVSPTRDFYRQKPLNETFELPEVVEIKTKDGRKLSFIETFKWYQDPVTQRRRLMTSYEDVTEAEAARQLAEDYLKAGTGSFLIQNEKYETLYVSEKAFELVKREDVYAINSGEMRERRAIFPDFDDDYWIRHRAEINALKT